MSGGVELYEKTILDGGFRPVAMQVLAAGALRPETAFEYVCRQKNIESVLFGSSSREHIQHSIEIITKYSQKTA